MKRIVVTGGSGFIGSNLVRRLTSEGHKVTIVDYKQPPEDLDYARYEDIYVEHIDADTLGDTDIIYHLAAQSRVQPSFEDPLDSFHSNVIGTQTVLETARELKCKVIYAGSSAKHADPYGSPYSTTKMMGEELCKMYRKCYDVDVEIARFWNVYGPGESLDPVEGNVIGIWRHNIVQGLDCQIVGDGEQQRDFIHVDDIVDGLIKIEESVSKHEDAWELGTAYLTSINTLASYMKERFPQAKFTRVADRKGNFKRPIMARPDISHRIGWEAKDKLREYILSL